VPPQPPLRRALALAIPAVTFALALVHCGSANQTPLGGPFGGTATVIPAPGAENDGGGQGGSSGSSSSGSSSGSSSSGSQVTGDDAGCSNTPTGVSASGAPTFSQLYTSYFATGTAGNCADTGCHPSDMDNASDSYTYLLNDTNAQYCGPPNCLASIANPCTSMLAWFNGSMPLNNPVPNAQAAAAVAAWVAAGSKNN
jgi:hypothetical protein